MRVEVEDTGPGVPPEDESKLFQPFFTTKPVGEGTGLGLSVSYGIIRSFGGTMGYRRGNTGGALFFFELPAARRRRCRVHVFHIARCVPDETDASSGTDQAKLCNDRRVSTTPTRC